MKRSSSENKEYWRGHILNARERGVTKAKYCSEQGISKTTFYYWDRKLFGDGFAKRRKSDRPSAFVPVISEVTSTEIQITLPNGIVVHCNSGHELSWVKSLVGLLHN